MKYFTLLYLFIFNFNLLSSGIKNAPLSNQLYTFTYISYNLSLGPVEGTEKLKVLMKNGNIISAWSLKTGQEMKDTKQFNILLDAINGNTKGLRVEYDDNNFPKSIHLETFGVGGGIFIKIKDFIFIDGINYTINIGKERTNEFEKNYQKWTKLDTKNYSFSLYNKDDDLHMEGVDIIVKNGKVVWARDSRTLEPIVKYEYQSFFTIPKLFAIVEKRLENNRQISVLYNETYGYPSFIRFEDKKGKQRTIASSLNTEKRNEK